MTGDGNRGNSPRPSEPLCPFAGTGAIAALPPAATAETEPPRMTLAELQRQVEERTAALRRANEALRLDESRLQTLLRLTEMTEASEREVTHFAMEEGIRLTGSKVGYLAFLNDDETVLTMHAWSKSAMAECAMIEKPIVYPVCNTGLWGEAVRQRRPIITNDYAAPNPWVKGTPPGHIKLARHMNIPVFDGRRIVAVAGVANKETPYDDSDVTQLRLLMDGMWQLLLRRRAEEELRRHRDHLEELVAARTTELRRAHDELKREVDERTQVQEQLRLAKDAAEAANRAKSEFLATMSHEIRTPMNGILGMTELALETVLTAEQRDYLQLVRKSADALLAVINAILDFSKIEAGKLELERTPFALREVLGDTLSALALRAHQKGLELAADVSEEVPDALVGDPGRLRQVLVNLVGNAIKFTEHGEVVIRVRPGDPAGCRLHFSVRDTGIGIPAEKQRLLFQPFTQVDGSLTRKYEGTGLGLAISARLVQMMGGQITVTSAPGQGSTFQFTAGFERQAGGGERRLPADPARLRGLPVLVVDDNATNRRILAESLTHRGLKPTAVDGAAAALAAVDAAHRAGTPFPLVLLDYQMPEVDGLTLAAQIRAHPEWDSTLILMLSSQGPAECTARCRDLRIAATLIKPIKQADLLREITHALGLRVPAAESSAARSAPVPAVRPLRILLAEDNAINRRLAVAILQKQGHVVETAEDGRQVLAALDRAAFDLVLMDVQMPDMDGLQATAAIRVREQASGGHLPIIAMTAHALKGDRERCLDAGMDGYVAKPLRPDELLHAIATHAPASGTAPPGTALDWSAALATVGGDRHLLAELAGLFLTESPGWLAEIRAAVAAGDAAHLRRAAHTLKGGVGAFAARPAVDAALHLETLGRQGDLAPAAAALTALEHEVARLRPVLTALAEEAASPSVIGGG